MVVQINGTVQSLVMPLQKAPMTEDLFEIEKRGYDAGSNPFMGEWKQKFNFQPVSYSNKSELKQEFKKKLRANLNIALLYRIWDF